MQSIIEHYNNEFKTLLNDNKKLLIEAFIKYYGECFRNDIIECFENMILCWGITDYFKKIYNDGYNKIKNNYSGNLLNILNDIKCLCESENSTILGFSNEDCIQYKNIVSNVLDYNKGMVASSISFLHNNDVVKLIYFDMFSSSDKDIIHEINHYLTTKVLGIFESNNIKLLIEKKGLSIFGDEKTFFEELINERSAMDITNIFNRLGGTLSQYRIISFNKQNRYFNFLPLIESFYIKYNKILKRVRIGENLNELFRSINENIYEAYINYINFISSQKFDISNSSNIIKKCDILVEKMYKKELKLNS